MKKLLSGLFLFLALAGVQAQVDVLRLPLGHSEFKYDLRLAKQKVLYSRALDRPITFTQLIKHLSGSQVVLLGEGHDNLDHHRFQGKVIRELGGKGKNLVVAMEFFRPEHNQLLADYVAGKIELEAMLARTAWQGFNYRLYAPVFKAARQVGAKMVGVNLPRAVVRKVSRKGLEALSKEERSLFPALDLASAEHGYLIKSIFGRMAVGSPKMFKGFYTAQCIWDTAMAANTCAALTKAGQGAQAIVIVGGGHVYYDLGIAQRLRKLYPGVSVSTVVQVAVEKTKASGVMAMMKKKAASKKPKGMSKRPAMAPPSMGKSAPSRIVSRSLADVIRGTEPAKKDRYPVVPVTFSKVEGGLAVATVGKSGVLAGKGLKKGDRLKTIDGRVFKDPAAIRIYLMGKSWGDKLLIELDKRQIRVTYKKKKAVHSPGKLKRKNVPALPALTKNPNPKFPHHSLKVTLDPQKGRLAWADRIQFPAALVQKNKGRFVLSLNKSMKFAPAETGRFGVQRLDGGSGKKGLQRWEVEFPPPYNQGRWAAFTGQGSFSAPPVLAGSDHARGFKRSNGFIGAKGVWLAGQSHWRPRLQGEGMCTYSLSVDGPVDWCVISQGKRLQAKVVKGHKTTVFATAQPQDEIYLVGGPLVEQSAMAGKIATRVYLHKQDKALAGRYLAATARYLKMYSDMIGPYPWQKFSLVENFWETGYGMPSFTLLGPRVIRFPWIIHSSYPHEILHNWWGNGVYVDYAKGNWCEGITAYLADHLFKEKKGEGAVYRLNSLERYTNFAAKAGRDFPLSKFSSRNSPATEAVGYGKALFVFHMLRKQLGDQVFFSGLRAFYRSNLHRKADWDDVCKAFEMQAKVQLAPWLNQWIKRTGAPCLKVSKAKVTSVENGYLLKFTVTQTQSGKPYQFDFPYAVYCEGRQKAETFKASMKEKQVVVERVMPSRPQAVQVDPGFDIFRKLLPGEVPPSLSQVLSSKKTYVVIPSAISGEMVKAYTIIANRLASGRGREVTVVKDNDPRLRAGIQTGCALWILGRQNKLTSLLKPALQKFTINGIDPETAKDTLVLALPGSGKTTATWGYINLGVPASAASLSRKLAHYGKYGYLVFKGPRAQNTKKGRWPQKQTPMRINISNGPG